MANPQVEDGHTEIANELFEAIMMVPMSDYEHRVFMFILRKTYGLKKKLDWISQKQITAELGIHKCHVSRTIRKLLEKNMIINIPEKNKKIMGIQKDYEQWKLPIQVTNKVTNIGNKYKELKKKLPIQVTEVTNSGNRKLPIEAHTKETIQKKLLQKKKEKKKTIPYKEIIEIYNNICKSLPQVQVLSESRKTLIRCRFNKYGIDKLKKVFEKAEASTFLTNKDGDSDRNWNATFDWLLNENNMIKVLEGNYNNKQGGVRYKHYEG